MTEKTQNVMREIKLEQGVLGLIITGANAGKIGSITEIKEGTFILPKRVSFKLEDREIEIPAKMIMPVGKDKPVIGVT